MKLHANILSEVDAKGVERKAGQPHLLSRQASQKGVAGNDSQTCPSRFANKC